MVKRVPAALHSELTEYSSLIRALRTSNTLDVTTHITKPHRTHDDGLNSEDDDSDSQEGGEDFPDLEKLDENDVETDAITNSNFPPSSVGDPREASSQPASPPAGASKKRKRRSVSPSRPRRRDTWTRWPLLLNDVAIPEWSLEDEIGILVADSLKRYPRPPLPAMESADLDDHTSNNDDGLEDGDPDQSYLPHVTSIVSNHLSTILALLVAHTPNRPHGQQNRIEPMDWRAVLDVLCSCGDPSVADQKCVPTSCSYALSYLS